MLTPTDLDHFNEVYLVFEVCAMGSLEPVRTCTHICPHIEWYFCVCVGMILICVRPHNDAEIVNMVCSGARWFVHLFVCEDDVDDMRGIFC